MGIISGVKFDENGLIPAILQNYLTGKVLMLGYMNEESLNKTIETREVWFYSRSRQELWHKGATSGNIHKVVDISFDCDQDAVLVGVNPMGPTCHLGIQSCFGEKSTLFLEELAETIEQRYNERPENSYTTYLFEKGIDKILKKVGEEASEVIIAAKNDDKEELHLETADLFYHLFVLFREKGTSFEEVLKVLKERRG
ncbi:phosphoribosyl-ATP pyrophosphatase /phosphoribosyl-AMP cyclohydrolase [Desulfonispora thiosulfatigenes DSM 11270]|uniref:Histidine biosynthesis bifunctional protein HisIE n=1 Tax=Desulfonispora thiosulfatigenes DSM 11270 TaxID=656914 RepID=A0A1W1V479_DESTI|nr:bifunctional phosphoribosyl-AMP cyclohydrolase/phosphoribosyl-ATP diphosphatase HisIE [Desulfonispora thiosulfatigenes]SMB88096.1 phosphoribosyl-ATP pyrophosphatase /phosphoribosyl-AMP cyclohydrolase [Desulfonispora thiosulfatigenes DSM 11270]